MDLYMPDQDGFEMIRVLPVMHVLERPGGGTRCRFGSQPDANPLRRWEPAVPLPNDPSETPAVQPRGRGKRTQKPVHPLGSRSHTKTKRKRKEKMKMLLSVTLPHRPFNAAVKDGTAASKLNRILEATKPEAVYFTERDGQRGAVLVLELSDASKIPALVEPWMLAFEADIELRPVMMPEDLRRAGLDEVGKKWS
jgi:hypothetical protein